MALFAGCSSEIIDTEDKLQNDLIGFSQITTKSGLDDVKANGFGVWASTSSSANNSASILTNEKVYFDGSVWDYDNTRYWIDDCKFFFFAVYPYTADNTLVTEHNIVNDGVNFTGYTMEVITPDSADYDPLVAINVTDTGLDDYSKTVNLQFQHMMTKINLKISQDFDKSPDFDYYVKKVSLSGIKGNGTLLAMPYGDVLYQAWNFDNATSKSFSKIYNTPVRLRNPNASDKKVTINIFGDGLLLIPQNIEANNVIVRVDYYYDINPNDDDIGVERYIEVSIPATDIWKGGQAISYSLALSEQTDIKFSAPTIESWGSPQTGGTIIIK